MQVPRTSEVNQYLHNPVKAMNFAVDDIYVPRRVRIKLLQFISKQLQMQDDGIDRILYLVGNATSHASAGRNTAREFNLVFNAAGRFGVTHCQQRADLRASFVDEVERNLNSAAVRHFNFMLGNIVMKTECVQHE